MNLSFVLEDLDSIDHVLFPLKEVRCSNFYNNFTFRLGTKNVLYFDRNYYTYLNYRFDDFKDSGIRVKYKLIIHPDSRTTINCKPNPNKVLVIRSVRDFDRVTKKYAYIEENVSDDDNNLYINWRKLSRDYAGIEIYNHIRNLKIFKRARFKQAPLHGEMYNSWLSEVFTTGGYLWRSSVIHNIKYVDTTPSSVIEKRRLKKYDIHIR